jgi:hypothetical protein
MSNDIEKFDPSKLMDGVRDRIKATFVSLIPDAQWEQLVQKEVENFFRKDLEALCKEILREACKEKVKETLKTYDTGIWDSNTNSYRASEILKKIMIENSSEIFASMLEGLAVDVVQRMRNRGW